MKRKVLSILLLGGMATLSSCIADEPLNAECDITGIDSLWLKSLPEGFVIGNPIVTNNNVSFTIKRGEDRSCLAPKFYLTPGASITALANGGRVEANGIERDFSTPQVYTVHSQDGNWKKDYAVAFNYVQPISLCSFEHFELADGKYYRWLEEDAENPGNFRNDYWSSGNEAFLLTGMGKSPEEFPTVTDPNSYNGNGVKLTTCDAGQFGASVNMPIAAGSIFLGEFSGSQAMLFPLKATRFGLQLAGGKPLTLSGYYKYTPGEVFTNKKGKVDPNRRDVADIYAVLFEVDPKKVVPLDGANVLSSDRIVYKARLDEPGEPKEWTYFEIPFVLQDGKTFDHERLNNNGYGFTLVASSSRDGAFFEGAVGSTLHVDELKVTWED